MTTLNNFEILSLYHTHVLKFLDSLIELFKSDESNLPDLIIMRILWENIIIEESMKKFSTRLLTPIKSKGDEYIIPADMIKKRNDKFFIDHSASIFAVIGEEKLGRWKTLWNSTRLDKEDRDQIWCWMDAFLGLAEMYTDNEQKLQ